jgi:hypothetical protein
MATLQLRNSRKKSPHLARTSLSSSSKGEPARALLLQSRIFGEFARCIN